MNTSRTARSPSGRPSFTVFSASSVCQQFDGACGVPAHGPAGLTVTVPNAVPFL